MPGEMGPETNTGGNIEKISKLKEALSQNQLYIIADALMRTYFNPNFSGDKAAKAKLKEIQKIIVAACPSAKSSLSSMK